MHYCCIRHYWQAGGCRYAASHGLLLVNIGPLIRHGLVAGYIGGCWRHHMPISPRHIVIVVTHWLDYAALRIGCWHCYGWSLI